MINYSVTMLANPMNAEEDKKAYARAQISEVYDIFDFAEFVVHHNSKYDVEDVLSILLSTGKRLRECLLQGRKVRLGKFGDFWFTISSTGAKTRDEFTEDNIRSINIIFTPGEYLQDLRKEAEFMKTTSRIAQASTLKAENEGKTFADWTPEADESYGFNSARVGSSLLPDA